MGTEPTVTVVTGVPEAAPFAARFARGLRVVALPFLFLSFGYQLVCAFQDVTFLNDHILKMDDAYYYFQVARNVVDLGWVTFDGIHRTSGIQVLWAALLAGLAAVVHDRLAFIRAILVLSAVLNLGTGLLLVRLGRRLYTPAVGHVAAILWSGFMLGLSTTMIGVEYPLHGLILVAMISAWWTIHRDPRAATAGRLQVLGLLLTLNYWNRLDSATLSVLVGLSVAVSLLVDWYRRRPAAPAGEPVRQILALGIWPVVGAAGYAAVCYATAGTPMPLSGLVKTFYASRHFADYGWLTSLAGHVSWWLRVEVRPLLDAISNEIMINQRPLIRPLPLAVIAGSIGATVWAAPEIFCERRVDERLFQAAQFIGLLWVFGTLHAAVIVVTIGYFARVTQHYFGWLFIAWLLWLGLIAQYAAARRGTARFRPAMAAAALVAVVMIANGVIAGERLTTPPNLANLHNRRLPVLAWIDRNLPRDARLGAWNAGQFGYFSNRTVVNLDGLANDDRFFDFLKSGAPMIDYLHRERIDYIVDNNALDMTMPYLASWDRDRFFHRTEPWSQFETVFVEPDQAEPIVILRVKP